MWFHGPGHHDHLANEVNQAPVENRAVAETRLPAMYYSMQSVDPELLEILRSFKTCSSFWRNAQDVFANDIQHLFDSTQKVVSLQQTNHDMISHMVKLEL